MENIIIATFTDEKSAKVAQHKLKHFDGEGEITIFNQVMIQKNSKGEIEYLSHEDPEGWRTLTAMVVGGLVGTLGGPIGFVLGLFAGTAIGAAADVSNYLLERDFIDSLGSAVPNGAVSIIAEVHEFSPRFIDELVGPIGGVVSRSSISFEHENYVQDQINTLDSEISGVEAKLTAAVEVEKETMSKEVAVLKNIRDSQVAEINVKGNEMLVELGKKFESNKLKIEKQVEKFGAKVSEAADAVNLELNEKMKLHYEKKLDEYKVKIDGVKQRLAGLKVARAA